MTISGLGSSFCIHATRGIITVESIRERDEVLQEIVVKALLKHGIYIGNRGHVNLNLSISDADIERILEAFQRALEYVSKRGDRT